MIELSIAFKDASESAKFDWDTVIARSLKGLSKEERKYVSDCMVKKWQFFSDCGGKIPKLSSLAAYKWDYKNSKMVVQVPTNSEENRKMWAHQVENNG